MRKEREEDGQASDSDSDINEQVRLEENGEVEDEEFDQQIKDL